MVFIGSGADAREVQDYCGEIGIGDKCMFPGAIRDREVLRAWYCRADLFLFPSTFDTNGLVVREAAACSLGSVLIRGSCAAEGVTDGRNGLLIEDTADSLCACLRAVLSQPGKMESLGRAAAEELYVSWEEAVGRALERYSIVIDRYRSGGYPIHREPVDNLLSANGNLMEDLANFQLLREDFRQNIRDRIRSHLPERFRDRF